MVDTNRYHARQKKREKRRRQTKYKGRLKKEKIDQISKKKKKS